MTEINLNSHGPQYEKKQREPFNLDKFLDDAVHAMRQIGLCVDRGSLDTTGTLTRCGLEHKDGRGQDGAYVVHLDDNPCPTALFWNHITTEHGQHTAVSTKDMSPGERKAHDAKVQAARAAREAKQAAEHAAAADKARKFWEAAREANSGPVHPYAAKKRLDFPPLVRRGDYMGYDCLIVPLFGADGKLWAVQAIGPGKVFGDADRDKTLLKGCKKEGSFFPFGDFRGASQVGIAEGLATAAAIHAATGLPCLMAVDKDNMAHVALIVRAKAAPGARIIICADDDLDTPGNPGIVAANKAAQAVGGVVAEPAMGRKADFWDLWAEVGPEAVKACIEGAGQERSTDESPEDQAAKELFPRRPFPWHVLPVPLAESFRQLGRAMATSATPAPAFAFCMLAAAVGRKFSVSPKSSWVEPLIFWVAHILDSGEGKTPLMQEMAKTLVTMQRRAHEAAKKAIEEFNLLSPKEKKQAKPPAPPRGYFVNGATLEGIHSEAMDHGTGGLVVMMSELSALLNSYGEYKSGGGSDREGWLCLYDGNTVRIARASCSKFIHDARIQICGGVQPSIFGKQFKSKDGTYLSDGTIFRFLMIYDPPATYEATKEAWSDHNRDVWDRTLTAAFAWAESEGREPVCCVLAEDAQERFLSWTNAMRADKQLLPKPFRGFVPKIIGAALRLAGAVHLTERFATGRTPGRVLDLETMEKGIVLAEFFAGQSLQALKLIDSPEASAPTEVSSRTAALASALDGLRTQTHDGRLSVEAIKNAYNKHARPEERVKSPRVFAGFLRSCGLAPMAGNHDYRESRRVTCLRWDDRIEAFIKGLERMERWREASLRPENNGQQGFGENGENGDKFSPIEKKRDLPEWAKPDPAETFPDLVAL